MAGSNLSVRALNLAEVMDYLDDFPEETFEDAKLVFRKAVLAADAEVKGNLRSKLKSRSGTLRRSLGVSVTGTNLANIKASTFGRSSVQGEPVPYTLTQEYGATIKAKKAYRKVPGGPYLNIPLRANKDASGVTRLNARQVFDQGGYLLRGTLGWAVMSGDDKAMFILVKKVTIPARLGMRDAADNQIPTILSQLQHLIGED